MQRFLSVFTYIAFSACLHILYLYVSLWSIFAVSRTQRWLWLIQVDCAFPGVRSSKENTRVKVLYSGYPLFSLMSVLVGGRKERRSLCSGWSTADRPTICILLTFCTIWERARYLDTRHHSRISYGIISVLQHNLQLTCKNTLSICISLWENYTVSMYVEVIW